MKAQARGGRKKSKGKGDDNRREQKEQIEGEIKSRRNKCVGERGREPREVTAC